MSEAFTILFADDDPEDRELMQQLFAQIDPSIEVVCFDNGLSLINHLSRRNTFLQGNGCIILDIKMPLWDGLQTLRTLRRENSLINIPVIVMSDSELPEDIKTATRYGATGYIVKPATQDQWDQVRRQLKVIFKRSNS